jgi:hypothetical protein
MALILERAPVSRLSGEWGEDDYDVLADGAVVGRIMRAAAAPEGTPWLWTLAFGHHEDRTPTSGYEATREAAMAPFAKSWRWCVAPVSNEDLCRSRSAANFCTKS